VSCACCCLLQTLHDLQLGGADDEGSMEAAINTVSAKDPAFISNPSALSYAPSRTASGKVRQVLFLDPEVAYWQTATQHAMVNGNSTNTPSAVNVHALDGTRWAADGGFSRGVQGPEPQQVEGWTGSSSITCRC
jgi:hypothetical protein